MTTQLPDKEQLVQIITQITVEVLKELQPQSQGLPEASTPAISCSLDNSDCVQCGFCTAKKPELVDQFIESGAARFTSKPDTPNVSAKIAPFIDHTLLKPDISFDDLKKLCTEAKRFSFKSVCVNPNNVPYCVEQLRGSNVGVTAVIGFPLGATTTRVKAFETEEAVRNGATEIDMVINVSNLRAKSYTQVLEDIQQVVRAARGYVVKVILETGSLEHLEKIAGCVLSKAAGAHYVKTSTGFGKGGATIEDIKLMRQVVGGDIGVKASGGIKDTQTAQEMISAGATRLGASASVAIVQGKQSTEEGY